MVGSIVRSIGTVLSRWHPASRPRNRFLKSMRLFFRGGKCSSRRKETQDLTLLRECGRRPGNDRVLLKESSSDLRQARKYQFPLSSLAVCLCDRAQDLSTSFSNGTISWAAPARHRSLMLRHGVGRKDSSSTENRLLQVQESQ